MHRIPCTGLHMHILVLHIKGNISWLFSKFMQFCTCLLNGLTHIKADWIQTPFKNILGYVLGDWNLTQILPNREMIYVLNTFACMLDPLLKFSTSIQWADFSKCRNIPLSKGWAEDGIFRFFLFLAASSWLSDLKERQSEIKKLTI